MKRIATVALASCFFVASAQAQNFELEPTFETVTLATGFEGSNHQVTVVAGGPIDASELGGECAGFIADAPDVRVNFTAGSNKFAFGAVSESDTTIVVNAPDGEWYCDDDSWGDGDPLVVFDQPESGQYDIWVGTFDEGDNPRASLGIMELTAGSKN